MNVTEAIAGNDGETPDVARVRAAAVYLADRADRMLRAGLTADDVVTSWPASAGR